MHRDYSKHGMEGDIYGKRSRIILEFGSAIFRPTGLLNKKKDFGQNFFKTFSNSLTKIFLRSHEGTYFLSLCTVKSRVLTHLVRKQILAFSDCL